MPSYNNPKKTHRYTNDFKIKAVQLSHLEGVQVKEIAEALDIHPFMLSRWRKEFREGKIKVDQRKKLTRAKPKPIKKSDNTRIRELEKQVIRVKRTGQYYGLEINDEVDDIGGPGTSLIVEEQSECS